MILYVIGGIGDVFFSICWLLLIFLQSWLVEKHNVFPCFDSTIFIPTDMVSLCFPGRNVWKTWFLWQDVGGKWKKHWTLQGRNLTERFHGVPSANSAGRLDWYWLGWATRQESGKWRAFKLFKKHVWFVFFVFADPLCVVFHVFTCFCVLLQLSLGPSKLKATTMAQKLENITLTARETNMAALFALTMHPGGMSELEWDWKHYFIGKMIWYRWAVVFVVLRMVGIVLFLSLCHICVAFTLDTWRLDPTSDLQKHGKNRHRRFGNFWSNGCILAYKYTYSTFHVFFGVTTCRHHSIPVSRLKWAISRSWIPLHPTKSFSNKKWHDHPNM